jgi:chromosome segregation ATPase
MSTTALIGSASNRQFKLTPETTYQRVYSIEPMMKVKQQEEMGRLQKEIQRLQRLDQLILVSSPEGVLDDAPIPDILFSIVTLPKEEADLLHAELKGFFAQIEADRISFRSFSAARRCLEEEGHRLREMSHNPSLEKQIEDYKKKLPELEKSLQEKRAERDRISNEIGDLCNKLKVAKNNRKLTNQLSQKKNHKDEVYLEINSLSAELQMFKGKKAQFEYDLSQYQLSNRSALESCHSRLQGCLNDIRLLEDKRVQRDARMSEIYKVMGKHLSREKIAETINHLTDQINRLVKTI